MRLLKMCQYALGAWLVATMACHPAPANATITIYTDRTAFLAAVAPGYFQEGFQALPTDTVLSSPQNFSGNGFGFRASQPNGLVANVYAGDIVLSVFSGFDTISIGSLTGPTPVTALGGYFFLDNSGSGPINPAGAMNVSATDGVNLATQALPAPTSFTGFVGFISDGPALTSLSFVRTTAAGTGFIATNDFIVGSANLIPEPASLAILGAGLFGLLAARRGRARDQVAA